jgi:putative flavoprotein involved in K+ transport
VPRLAVAIIGAGQAGLAMSHCLSARGIDHIVLERGAVAERWRRDGWDSLRLLTPNWMTRLPGFAYSGGDPDGFMRTSELVALLEQYATSSHAPVETHTTVRRVTPAPCGFHVVTTRGVWEAATVVVATGYCDRPAIPRLSARLAPWIEQLPAEEYHNPEQLPPDGVLIVGASATGVQLADEIQRSGRQVVLAVGRHTRLPRKYRGRDILWWLDRLGVLSQEVTDVHDIDVSRRQPSLQLVGRPDHATVDLARLRAIGVRLAGHVTDISHRRVQFADDLVATAAAADVKLATVLLRIDEFISQRRIDADEAGAFEPTWCITQMPPISLDLVAERIRTVIWATGYRRTYPWLRVPVLDTRGEILHRGGVTPYPNLYVLGMNFQRRRNSSFIDGVGADAEYLARLIAEQHGSPVHDSRFTGARRHAS